MKRFLAFFTGIMLSTVAFATDNPIGCQGNSCSVTLYSRTSGGTATLGLKLDGTQSLDVGPPTPASTIYHHFRGAVVADRDGTVATSNGGSYASAAATELTTNYIRGTGSGIGLITATGYTRLTVNRSTTAGGTVLSLLSDFQDAQTAGAAAVGTNEKTVLQVTGDGTTAIGQSGGSQIHTSNGAMKIVTGIASNFTVGSGATGASLFIYQIGNSNNQTCTTSCGATRPTGANASSGACLAAWNSSGNPSTCATAAANNFCTCLAIP